MLTKNTNIFKQSSLLEEMKDSKMYQHTHKNKSQVFTPEKTKIFKHFDWSIFGENPNAQPLIM